MENLSEDNFTGNLHENQDFNTPFKLLTASSVTGDKVHDENDEAMGDIKDIMLDVISGKIEYYIVEFGGFLGIDTKYFAIPFNLLTVDPEKRILVFKHSKEMLENAPGFNTEHWPDTNYHVVNNYWQFV
jgi:sporulation protein YlmC with PRC-barrel domain